MYCYLAFVPWYLMEGKVLLCVPCLFKVLGTYLAGCSCPFFYFGTLRGKERLVADHLHQSIVPAVRSPEGTPFVSGGSSRRVCRACSPVVAPGHTVQET